MKIGDKVIINRILPLTATGRIKPIKMVKITKTRQEIEDERTTFVDLDGQRFIDATIPVAKTRTIFHPVSEKITKSNGNVIYRLNKVDIGQKEGVLVGFLKKKLSREYTANVGKIPDSGEVLSRIARRRDRNRRSPNRVDNFHKLDTAAIIALSNYKMVVVDVKDLIFNNIKTI